MIFAALLSLTISLFFLIQIWRLKQPVTEGLVSNLDLLHRTAATSETALQVIETTVTNLAATTTALEETTLSTAQTIHNTGLLVDTFSTLSGEDFPTIITNTQSALASAQTSAIVIDNVLSALASIPLIGIDYNPETPLNQALAQVSASLSPLPAELAKIQDNLDTTNTSLQSLEETVVAINLNLQDIQTNLANAQVVIDEYQVEVSNLETRLARSREIAPVWVLRGTWILTFLVIWLGISQLGMLVEGLDMFTTPRSSSPHPVSSNTDLPAQKE
jgi:hypothetical protein